MSSPIAEVRCMCGRMTLLVCGIAVAMEGDKCRQMLPDDVMEDIPQHELATATINGESIATIDKAVVQFFRGEKWQTKSLEWAAETINQRAKSHS